LKALKIRASGSSRLSVVFPDLTITE